MEVSPRIAFWVFAWEFPADFWVSGSDEDGVKRMAGMKENVRKPSIGFGRECFGNPRLPPPRRDPNPRLQFPWNSTKCPRDRFRNSAVILLSFCSVIL